MRKLLLIAATVFAFTACSDEKTGWGQEETPNAEQMGYLNFADDALSVIIEQEIGNSDVGSGAESDTRAEETENNYVNVTANDGYWIQILDKDGNLVNVNGKDLKFEYSKWLNDKSTVPGYVEEDVNTPYVGGKSGIKLPVGTYTVKATSVENVPTSSLNAVYEGHTDVTIGKAAQETVDVECTLASVKVTIKFDNILADLITVNGTEVAAKLGSEDGKISEHTFKGSVVDNSGKEVLYNTVTHLTTQSYPVYLLPQNEGINATNPLNLYLTTIYDGNAINAQQLPVTNNAKRGEWRNITIKLEHGDQGTVNFKVTVETIVYNETVVVEVNNYTVSYLPITESGIPDIADAPYFESLKYDLTNVINPNSMFDNENYVGPLMNLKSKSAITALYLTASSTNLTLNEAFAAITNLNLMEASGQAKLSLDSWGIPNGASTFATAITDAGTPFSFEGFVKMIRNNDAYAGVHTFTFKAEAGAGSVSETTIKIGASERDPNAPTVTWNGGILNEFNTLTTKTQLELVVEVANGRTISSLIINIEGGIADLLGGVGMPSEFDLVDPDGAGLPGLSTSLVEFGFPVGDEVNGKTKVIFTISDMLKNLMLGQLATLPEKTAVFRLTVTDNEGIANTGGDAMMLEVK